MSFIRMWKNALNFKTTVKMKEFWIAILINLIVGYVLSIINIKIGDIYYLASIVPVLSMSVRRLKDSERSASNLLWLFVPIIGWIILLLALSSLSRSDRDREFDRYHC